MHALTFSLWGIEYFFLDATYLHMYCGLGAGKDTEARKVIRWNLWLGGFSFLITVPSLFCLVFGKLDLESSLLVSYHPLSYDCLVTKHTDEVDRCFVVCEMGTTATSINHQGRRATILNEHIGRSTAQYTKRTSSSLCSESTLLSSSIWATYSRIMAFCKRSKPFRQWLWGETASNMLEST